MSHEGETASSSTLGPQSMATRISHSIAPHMVAACAIKWPNMGQIARQAGAHLKRESVTLHTLVRDAPRAHGRLLLSTPTLLPPPLLLTRHHDVVAPVLLCFLLGINSCTPSLGPMRHLHTLGFQLTSTCYQSKVNTNQSIPRSTASALTPCLACKPAAHTTSSGFHTPAYCRLAAVTTCRRCTTPRQPPPCCLPATSQHLLHPCPLNSALYILHTPNTDLAQHNRLRPHPSHAAAKRTGPAHTQRLLHRSQPFPHPQEPQNTATQSTLSPRECCSGAHAWVSACVSRSFSLHVLLLLCSHRRAVRAAACLPPLLP
jgi:hypothetical protein